MFSAGRLFFVFSTKIFSIGRAYIYNCKTNFGKSGMSFKSIAPMEMATVVVELESHKQQGNYAADILSIQEARVRIGPYIDKTPILSSTSLNVLAGRTLFFKCEIFQKGGAFKFRGACNAVFSLPGDLVERGVVTHSSGNHAAALALAAKIRGTPAYIVIPKTAPACKVENVRRYGGQVIWCEPTIESRESVAARVQEETGAVLIHPFNDGRIISGQGTISLELLEQVADLDAIVVPISDLLVGKRVRAQHREQIHKKLQTEESVQIPMHLSRTDFSKALKPDIHIFAAEPKGADDAARSKVAGRIITLPETKTIADGLRAWLGDLTWPIVRDLVDDVIVVEEREIVEAMKMCYEILKVVVEPSGAIGLAAVLSRQFQDSLRWLHCKKIGVVLSGANIDLAVLWESFQKLY
ncbi:serine racemase isoform X2 [Cryptomeria japonica]|uniref:serine racemase isoform X2 n=1 Tax=Cryptomeria japonica TaxID=3369 RepID=UPI0027D9E85D|nr:serine racemase isoform X2 [Cryptomeria japonica]